jgi:uridine kinase
MPLEARAHRNFDEPAAFDWPLFEAHVEALAQGSGVDMPVYDFAIHTRHPETVRVEAHRFIIVEGLLALWSECVRALSTLRVYVDLLEAACLERRVHRDTAERGRTLESVRTQFEDTVAPMAERHVAPTRQFAEVVVRGDMPVEELIREVLARLSFKSN